LTLKTNSQFYFDSAIIHFYLQTSASR